MDWGTIAYIEPKYEDPYFLFMNPYSVVDLSHKSINQARSFSW